MPPPFGRRRPGAGAAPSRGFVRRKIERCRRAGKGSRQRGQAGKLRFVVRPRSYLWIALILATPSPTHAQQDSARLEGTARSALNGRPLAGVMITVRDHETSDIRRQPLMSDV